MGMGVGISQMENHGAQEMGVRKDDRHGECAEDDIAKLDAARRDDIAETKVLVFAKELREIMKDEEESEGAAIQITRCELEISFFQEWSQKLKEGEKELVGREPAPTELQQFRHDSEESYRYKHISQSASYRLLPCIPHLRPSVLDGVRAGLLRSSQCARLGCSKWVWSLRRSTSGLDPFQAENTQSHAEPRLQSHTKEIMHRATIDDYAQMTAMGDVPIDSADRTEILPKTDGRDAMM
ncbi:hypothetical protein DEU56DRAFT_756393 [Suillus clintonianus]|uniref:uncharacterized protein n=1 Tax=Suillus clintonianus TaxID=1904413 RepID=UPI001B8777AA|nr:uncharacterized protein DEU56DRAFT_756393 [Suillus clintonianus]KAG2135983.1 hypothetical protein DEU56DRAFT_756393 [Suillus clintonianus]